MTEEYRVPDGMVGLSECGSLWSGAPIVPHSGTVSWEPLPAQELWSERASCVLLSPVLSGQGEQWSSRHDCCPQSVSGPWTPPPSLFSAGFSVL